jgi:hypothetical protein
MNKLLQTKKEEQIQRTFGQKNGVNPNRVPAFEVPVIKKNNVKR